MLSCSGFGLPMHAQLLRLFATYVCAFGGFLLAYVRFLTTITSLCNTRHNHASSRHRLRCDACVVSLSHACLAPWFTRTRNVSLPTQANHTTRGARKQPPNWDATHAASEDTTHTSNHTAGHQGRKRRPARHPPRAQQVPSQHTHN